MAKPTISDLIRRVIQRGENVANDAAYGGHHHDGGGGRIKSEAEFYLMGMNGEVPKEWEKDWKQLQKESDPDYEKYLSLKKKFE